VEESDRHVQVVYNGKVIADTRRAKRVLETSHPPVYYIPPEDVQMHYLAETGRRTWCEWKGQARYYALRVGKKHVREAAWFYPAPTPGYEGIAGYVAFYPGRMDACYLDGERVQAQPGDFYGGWITSEIVGPFKGGPGTLGW
jgi:uncharacterized protein (DUF427 family)